ncbi:LOW QUALITY PROTEIN: CDP-glycerol:polyglycerol phosphate glycero-phosphotransferase, partial [Streptomyces sp. e14]
MPRFSVIVPCFKVQGFLRECLDSVLGQSFRDVEVIAVDDCSPDGSGAILDEYAARDPRVRVVHLAENVGLGRARNAGLPLATGDFLLFLDSDDTLTPGALRALADRLEQTADPDVLVFDYARTYWWGGTRRNVLARVLADCAEGTFTAAERPEILDLLMVVWNKAYRRGFVEEHGFTFPPGYYEDTPWTFPVLLSAGRIATLDRICLHYRQRRQGNILSTTSRKHFDIHDQYERVFAFVDSRPELARWRPYLHRKMGEHCLDILAKPDRLPPSDKAEFFRATARMFRAHRPAGTGVEGELRVLEGSYAAYLLRRQTGRAERELARRAAKARRAAGRRAKDGWAALHARRPLEPDLVLYSAFHSRGVLGDPAAVYRAAREIAPHLRGVWVVKNPELARESGLLPPDVEYVLPGTPRHRRLAARAGFLVNNVNWPDAQAKRPGSVHIHTHLGTPLKYMGADLLDKAGRAARGGRAADAGPRGPLGPQPGRQPPLRAGLGARLPVPFRLRAHRQPAQRRAGRRAARGRRGPPRPARDPGGPHGGAVRADPARVPARRLRRADRPGPARRGSGAGPHAGGPAAPVAGGRSGARHGAGRAAPARSARRRDGRAVRRRGDARLRRPGHRLLRPDVRLRQSGPADRAARRRLGRVRGEPGRLLRRHRRAAGPCLALPRGAGAAADVRPLAGRGVGAAAVGLPGPVLRVRRRLGGRAGGADADPRRAGLDPAAGDGAPRDRSRGGGRAGPRAGRGPRPAHDVM